MIILLKFILLKMILKNKNIKRFETIHRNNIFKLF